MENKKLTADDILLVLSEAVKNQKQIPKEKWLDCSWALNTLIIDEIEKLENLRLELAKLTNEIIQYPECKSFAQAKLMALASPLSKDMRMQEAKVEQIKQFIMISKQNASNF